MFNPAFNLLKIEKLKLCGSSRSNHFTEVGASRVYDILEDWNFEFNGKITIRSVSDNSDINVKTVSKYWYIVKDSVEA